ncbi:MAG: hypothetical protein WAO89_09030, partial [Kiritimatiellia bacterium]
GCSKTPQRKRRKRPKRLANAKTIFCSPLAHLSFQKISRAPCAKWLFRLFGSPSPPKKIIALAKE